MKYCLKCGSEMRDEAVFCIKCGANNKILEREENSDYLTKKEDTPPEKPTKKIIISIIVAVIVISLAAGSILIIKNRKGKPLGENTTASDSSVSIEDSDTSSDDNWKRAFSDYFEEISDAAGFSENSDAYILDLDGDNIPEVIGGWHGFLPMIAYYDDGEIKEVYLPDENIIHSTASAGEEPNALFFDAEKNIIIQRCVGKNEGTMFNRTAIAYKYGKGKLTEYKSISLDLKPEDFENISKDKIYQAVVKRFDEQFKEFIKEFTLTAFNDVARYFNDLEQYFSETFGFHIRVVPVEEKESLTKQESNTESAVPVLTDENAFDLLKSAFDAYSACSLYSLATEYDINDTVSCDRLDSEWMYEQGGRWLYFDDESDYYYYEKAIPDGRDIRVKNFNSKKDMVSFLQRYFTGEFFDYQIELIEEAFKYGILHEENGKLYYCPEYGINRGTYDMRLTGMKVTKKLSDTEYVVTLYTPTDYNYPDCCLETDSYLIKYDDGAFKISDSYDYETGDIPISEDEFDRMWENDYFITL